MYFGPAVSATLLALVATQTAAAPTSKERPMRKLKCPEGTFQEGLNCIDPRAGPDHALLREYDASVAEWAIYSKCREGELARGRFCSNLPGCETAKVLDDLDEQRDWGCPPGTKASPRVCRDEPLLEGKCPKGLIQHGRVCKQRFIVPEEGCPGGTHESACFCYPSNEGLVPTPKTLPIKSNDTAKLDLKNPPKRPKTYEHRKFAPENPSHRAEEGEAYRDLVSRTPKGWPLKPRKKCPKGTAQVGRICIPSIGSFVEDRDTDNLNRPPRECAPGTEGQGGECSPPPTDLKDKPNTDQKTPSERPTGHEKPEHEDMSECADGERCKSLVLGKLRRDCPPGAQSVGRRCMNPPRGPANKPIPNLDRLDPKKTKYPPKRLSEHPFEKLETQA